MKTAGIDRKVSVLNTTAEGRQVVLTEVLRADKNEGEKTKLVSAENKLQINHYHKIIPRRPRVWREAPAGFQDGLWAPRTPRAHLLPGLSRPARLPSPRLPPASR